jgi:predicted acylesterase/phospholipase RssA
MNHPSRRDLLALAGTGVAGATAIEVADARQPKARRKYLILACDGGGVRGAMTARIVQRMEEELGKATRDKVVFRKRVDCFAGTSTGGIIALGLACDKTPADLVRLYKENADEIFKVYTSTDKTDIETKMYAPFMKAMQGLDKTFSLLRRFARPRSDIPPPGWSERADQLFFVRYESAGVRKVLAEVFGEDLTLAKLPPGRSVLVTTFRLGTSDEAWQPVMLHNMLRDPDAEAKRIAETTVLDAALCTSAAPTYFAPHKHPQLGYCADGGVFANNPGVAALSMARRAGHHLDDIRLVSVGTGSVSNYMKVPPWEFSPKEPEEARGTRCGLIAWLLPKAHDGVPATPLLSAVFDAGALADETYCKGILGDGYRRIQVRLKKDIPLDDTRSIPDLIDLADAYFEPDNEAWKKDKAWLLQAVAP